MPRIPGAALPQDPSSWYCYCGPFSAAPHGRAAPGLPAPRPGREQVPGPRGCCTRAAGTGRPGSGRPTGPCWRAAYCAACAQGGSHRSLLSTGRLLSKRGFERLGSLALHWRADWLFRRPGGPHAPASEALVCVYSENKKDGVSGGCSCAPFPSFIYQGASDSRSSHGPRGKNGLFGVSALTVFLWDIYIYFSLSFSKLSDTVLLRDPFGEGDNIQIQVELNRVVQTLLEVWKSNFC